MWAVPKGGGIVLHPLKQDGVPPRQTQKSGVLLGTHIVHTWVKDLHVVYHQSFQITADCLYIMFTGRHFVLVFILESYL